MAKTISNILTGVATLSIGTPNSRAQWSTEIVRAAAGAYSIKITKRGGAYGSTGVLFNYTGPVQTIDDFDTDTDWGFWYYRQNVSGAYWMQMEYRFEDPDTTGWVDISTQTLVEGGPFMADNPEEWEHEVFATDDHCFFGGWSEPDGSFSNWTPADISVVATTIDTAAASLTAADVKTWELKRVRCEIWESVPDRWAYVNSFEIAGVAYHLAPGDTTEAGILLAGPWTEIGYTEDGITIEYTADEADVEVEEETFPINRVITKETVNITCNMAESSLYNIDKAMAGSLLAGSILKLGAGVNKAISLQIVGTNPAGFYRSITIPFCTATGAVGMSYRKGEKTIIPVTFQALKTADEPAVTIVDNAA